MTPVQIAFLLLAALGHAGTTVGVANRVNSLGWPRRVVKSLDRLIYLGMAILAAWIAWQLLIGPPQTKGSVAADDPLLRTYLIFAAAVGALVLGAWFRRRYLRSTPDVLRSSDARWIDIGRVLGYRPVHGPRTAFLSRVPCNQLLQLEVAQRELVLPRLPSALDGLTIAHVSDFHLTGRVGKPFFQEAVRLTNELDCDLVAITGDVFDSANCIDWVSDTLAQLRSRMGVFYILGNHDLRTHDLLRVRRTLDVAGLIDLGATYREIVARGQRIVLAGNERPWFRAAADMQHYDRVSTGDAFRILLSHSPDQVGWARQHRFDLVLTGHTHGGQICFPLIGPIVCPSRFGVRYASGVFHLPPCVVHVTRGVSSKTPVRINCRPEIVKLVLRSG